MKNKILIKKLTVSFSDLTVIEGLDLEISESTAVMGASGKGKTTLVRAVMGLLQPDAGEISFAREPRFSAVFQEDRLFDDFSAIENIVAVRGKKTSKKEAEQIASALLKELLIDPEEQRKAVRDYSGGMRRRVAIARALFAESDILVLDEPYKGLDVNTRAVCAECVRKHSSDKLVLLITHDETEAELSAIKNIISM